MTRRILEGRAPGLLADRLGQFAARGDFGDLGRDGFGIVGRPAIGRLDPDDVGRGLGVAIGVAEIGQRIVDPLTRPAQAPGRHEDVLRLGAVAPRIHGQGPADGARNAGIELQPAQPGLGRGPRHHGVQRPRPCGDRVALGRDPGERPPGQPHHDTLDPAVAHDDIGTHAQHGHRHGRVQRLEEVGKVVGVSRDEQGIRRPADPEPSVGPQRLVTQQLAADRGQGDGQGRSPSKKCWICCSRVAFRSACRRPQSGLRRVIKRS